MKYENQDDLRQRLLELHYDLLDDDEAAELRAAIASDPDVAAQWASTLRLADKMADAAKFQGAVLPEIDIRQLAAIVDSSPSSNGKPDSDSLVIAELLTSDSAPVEPAASPAPPRRWWVGSMSITAIAAAIGMMVIGSWYFGRVPEAPMAVVRVEAQPIISPQSTSDNEFQFVTTRVDGSSSSLSAFPVTPATLSFSVLARNTVLFSGKAETDHDGTGRVTLPSDLVIPRDAKLRVIARSADRKLAESSIEVPLEPTRCLTYLAVDRPVYRPGETVYFRSLTLQRNSLRANSDVPIRFELIDPSGAVVPGLFTEGVTDLGVGNGAMMIPTTAPGGPYKLVARSLDGFFPDEECEFQIRAYRVPRFKKELEFRKRSYGPGERVEADFLAERAEGGPLANAAVRITATVDGEVVHQSTATTSASGTCLVSFELPTLINEGAGQLSIAIDDGGTQETKSKTIPIQLGRVVVDFYAEGGYLVDGLANRVYFTAHDTLGNPIHIAGEILDRSGQAVASIETTHDGMGRFSLTPTRGQRYTLKVTQPVDVTNHPKLPAIVKDLPVIDTGTGVFGPRDPITMTLRSKAARTTIVRAVCRGRLVGHRIVKLRAGDNSVVIPIADDAGGVVRVTVLDGESVAAPPLVERLVYRRNEKRLQVEIVDAESALERSPGDPMRLTLQVRDETGEPAPAVLGVSVVDDASLSLDEVERPRLRTHFLLTSEVEKPEDLEHANFYLSDDPEAAEALDLLLGTQGWRRFVSGSATQPNVDFREQLIRLIELDGDRAEMGLARYDNVSGFARQWDDYGAAVQSAWNRLVIEARMLMLILLFVWLFTVLVQMRRYARVNVAVWLLMASTFWMINGCGVQSAREASVVATDATPAPPRSESAKEETDRFHAASEPQSGSVPDDAPPAIEPAQRDKYDDRSVDSTMLDSALSAIKNAGFYVEDQGGLSGRKAAATGEASQQRSISQQELQQLLAARGLDAEALADQLLEQLRFPVRQYAHRHQRAQDDVRDDFAETLYWQPMLITDSEGRATIRFDLSDSVTMFRVSVDGHANDGRIGSGGGEIVSRLPFQIEPKMPLEVTMGDRIDLPIAVINATDAEAQVGLSVSTDPALQLDGDSTRTVQLPAGDRRREHVSIRVAEGSAEQDASIEIHGVAGSLADSVRRTVHVAPAGYPSRRSIAGRLHERATVQLAIPEDYVPGSLAVTVRAYPSPLADVMSGVESILREPHGCFEQTSATNYPNTMALLYMRESQTANPEVSRRALGMLDRGYQKLISFECQKLGYEWFGSDPGHEALSAFGLMQFTDMAQVMDVSGEMIARTRQWLLARRDGTGGFHRNPRHLHVWSVQQPIVNAYVLWAVTEADVAAGQPHRAAGELALELDTMHRVATESDDPYLVALSAAALMNVKRTTEGEALLEKLVGMQDGDGGLQGKTTVTSSGGLSLKMETTALATLAWIKSPRFLRPAQAAAKWIAEHRQGNAGFGSTQATVLALKALIAMADHMQTHAGGDLRVMLGGEVIGQAALPREPRSGSAVEITGLGTKLEDADKRPEEFAIELVGTGSRNLNYTIEIACNVFTPESDDACPVKLTTAISGIDESVDAGEQLKVAARLVNTTGEGQPMTVAIVGLPGGVEPRVEELDELREAGGFDYYEIRGRDIVFYWRTIEPGAVKEVDFHVTASIPGKYTGPASRAYLYYTAEEKQWSEPLQVEINR